MLNDWMDMACRVTSYNQSYGTILKFIYITMKTRHFCIRLAGFRNLIFFCIDQMAKTNAKKLFLP